MKKWGILIAILLCAVAAVIVLCVFAEKPTAEKTLTSVTVGNLPEEAVIIGEFDSAGITLNLQYSNGETEVLPVSESMFSDEYKELLHTPGANNVAIVYGGLTVTFTVNMREKYQWSVTFHNALDETVKTQEFLEGERQEIAYPTAEEMAVDGYRFTGFAVVSTPVTQNITVKGEYVKTWVVRFYNCLNAVISEQVVDGGSSATEPTEAQRAAEGYNFLYWSAEFGNISKDMDIYGVYSKNTSSEQDEAYTRIDENGNLSNTGSYILFGTYPQAQETNAAITAALGSVAGALPASNNSGKWTSYGYYINKTVQDFMWYIDIPYLGETYRGVYFTSYRPYYTNASSGSNYQSKNGYSVNTVYWFKFEPIKWRILEEEGGTATLLCETIIDCREYYPSDSKSSFNHNDGRGYANNYALSDIRKWLNETFYNTAFSNLQKEIIEAVNVDNSARSANPDTETVFNDGVNTYSCKNTTDNVWLLSEREVTRGEYGFSTGTGGSETRYKNTTAYARAQGAHTSSEEGYAGNGYWWLRSPSYEEPFEARFVDFKGFATYTYGVNHTYSGIVPALKISLYIK